VAESDDGRARQHPDQTPYTAQVTNTYLADYSLTAKLTALAIQFHTGSLFGLANQIIIALIATAALVLIDWATECGGYTTPTAAMGHTAGAAWRQLPPLPLTLALSASPYLPTYCRCSAPACCVSWSWTILVTIKKRTPVRQARDAGHSQSGAAAGSVTGRPPPAFQRTGHARTSPCLLLAGIRVTMREISPVRRRSPRAQSPSRVGERHDQLASRCRVRLRFISPAAQPSAIRVTAEGATASARPSVSERATGVEYHEHPELRHRDGLVHAAIERAETATSTGRGQHGVGEGVDVVGSGSTEAPGALVRSGPACGGRVKHMSVLPQTRTFWMGQM